MRKLLLIALVTLLSLPLRKGWGGSVFAQSSQAGLVLEYQGEKPKTPLPNVGITAQNAGATQSADDGSFSLQFRTLHPGDNIQMRRVERSGYEVMNQEVMETFRIGREGTAPLQIVMITKARLNELRNGYRSVATRRYEKQLEASEEEIERLKAEGKLAEEEYNERMNALEEEYEERLNQLESYIDKFARIDLSEIDAIEQQIIALVQAGDMDAALRLYEEQGLPAKLAQSRADREKLADTQSQLAQAQQEQEQKNLRLRQSIDRQVTLLQMMGGEENQRKALNLRREVWLADTTHCESLMAYASLLQSMGYIEEAIALLERGAALTDDMFDRGRMLLHVAIYHRLKGSDENLVYEKFQSVFDLVWPLRDSKYLVLTRVLPVLTDNMINILPFVGRDEEIQSWVDRQRQHWTPDTLDQVSLQNYVNLLLTLTEYDSQMERHEQSITDLEDAIRLFGQLEAKAPWLIARYNLLTLACHTYAFEGRIESLAASDEAIQAIAERLPKVQATVEVPGITIRAYELMEAMILTEQYDRAEAIWQQIETLRLLELTEERFAGWADVYVGFLRLFGSYLTLQKGDVSAGEAQMNAALTALAAMEDAEGMLPFLRPASLARVAFAKGDYPQTEALYTEAIKAQLAVSENQPDAWDSDNLCHYYVGLADVAQAQGNKKQTKKWLKEASRYASFEMDRQLVSRRK